MNAILYPANTGSTARYAQLLGQETGLPVCPLCEARATVAAETSRAQ